MTEDLLGTTSEQPKAQPNRRGGAQVRLHFQDDMMKLARPDEIEANEALLAEIEADERWYKYNGKQFAEDHFSRNVHIIDKTRLFNAAHSLPKGAHLHLHFNSTLLPKFLLGIAKDMPNMYISSPTHKLRSKSNFDNCEIVFTLQNTREILDEPDVDPILQEQKLSYKDLKGPNLFHDDYEPRQLMRYQYFRSVWNEERKARQNYRAQNREQTGQTEFELWDMNIECDDWLTSKLIFHKEQIDEIFHPEDKASEQTSKPETKEEEQARQKQAEDAKWPKDIELDVQNSQYKDVRKRAARAWDRFNGRTRMMKGLFNYERAFRAYTRKCLEEFVRDNVQYAEIRPNFMKSNQVLRDDGSEGFNNFGLMEIIIEEYENFMKDIGDMDEHGQIKENRKLDSDGKLVYLDLDKTRIPCGNGHTPSLGGMKVIYCTPRSFPKPMVKEALEECIQMKKRWPQYIAGFDLVGEEAYDKKYPLRYFEEEFRQFQEDCRKEKVEIPFLFHCGETPDDIEGNLECALDLNARRIGHGYALPQKPDIMKEMKDSNVCVEACPISNMVLGLVERMDEHRIYELLKHEVHCTLNSDNGTLFRSTLSHDFYEVMVGNRSMNLFGWRQLARWSIDHACMSQVERERVLVEWERRWKDEFIPEILGKQSTSRLARLDRLDGIEEGRKRREGEAKLN
ncbi:Metallo-dependent hydrolase [Daldinia vernicosa]|uniref:Metallo-dependent hydrolase n=1 Tax=Daldinia vernicosa TaxID=114800 RepID=UPI00200721EA|nr:Metallo-dependent hydrolase [Daldinia vernicosa]KAI0847287.1 Metallo-dependent hydrolase [Daldinia vernicosa]